MAQRQRRSRKIRRNDRRRLSVGKKLLFAGVATLLAFGSLEAALWLIGVQPAWVTEDPYAGFSRHIPHFVRDDEGRSGDLVVSPGKSDVLNDQRFPAEKPDGTFRIVCLGGSTTYGRPFFDATSFAGWLRAFLPVAAPGQSWEVINAGGISYASYRVEGVMQELAEYDPDLFIVYTGQNEFLERRTYGDQPATSVMAGPVSLLYRTRTATVVRGALDAVGLRGASGAAEETQLGAETKAIPVNAIGPEAYHRDAELAEEVVAHFRATLGKMVSLAEGANADILFVVPASNLADFAPFRSEHRGDLSDADLAEWNRHEIRARTLIAQDEWAAALEEIDAALAFDDRYAELWFLKGQTLVQLGEFEPAREAFLRAVDEDVCPLRAITPIVNAVRDTRELTGHPAVDFERLVRDEAEHGLPGDDLFHDHVHPTIEANRLLALAILDALESRGLATLGPNWNEDAVQQVTDAVHERIDPELHAKQLRLLAALLGWLHQPDAARTQAELSLELSGRTESALLDLAQGLHANQSPELALEYFRQAAEVAPGSGTAHFRLAVCALETGRTALGIEHLKAAVDADPDLVEARVRLGVSLAGEGHLQDAEVQLAAAAELDPDSATVHNNLGLVIAKQGRYREALRHYARSLSLDRNASSTHFNAALAFEQLGQVAEAITHYEATIRLAEGHAEAAARLQALRQR